MAIDLSQFEDATPEEILARKVAHLHLLAELEEQEAERRAGKTESTPLTEKSTDE